MISSAMRHTMDLEGILACIRRDPASWQGVSLLYAQLPPGVLPLASLFEEMHARCPDMLVFDDHNGGYLALGGQPLDLPDGQAHHYLWMDDIARQWHVLAGLLHDAPPSAPAPHLFAYASILVVEDDPMTSQIASKHLKPFGSVIAGSDSKKAVANYMVHRPDIVFLDIHYRDDRYDGFDVLRDLLSADKDAFIVMVSSDRDAATIFKALSSGAQGFIGKPFKPADFAHYLNKFSRRRAAA